MPKDSGSGITTRSVMDDLEAESVDTYRRLSVSERYASLRANAFLEGMRVMLYHLVKLEIIVLVADTPESLNALDEQMLANAEGEAGIDANPHPSENLGLNTF
jgi:hypothetical protein